MVKTIGVIASGPSCTAEDARLLCSKVETIAVNDCYRLGGDHLYACDFRWWRHHIADVLRDFEGKLWTQHQCWTDDSDKPVDPKQWGIEVLESKDSPGLSRTPGVIHTGSNSGFQALNLAYLMGAQRIILLGFDMQMDGNKRHWFGDHPGQMNSQSCYRDFISAFETIKPADYGLSIINCTRKTALNCFPKQNLEECLASL